MKKRNKIALVTFGLFMTEAILHYNMGKQESKEVSNKRFLPPTKSLIKIGVIVGAFSIINSIILDD
jgi:hypothetical protein